MTINDLCALINQAIAEGLTVLAGCWLDHIRECRVVEDELHVDIGKGKVKIMMRMDDFIIFDPNKEQDTWRIQRIWPNKAKVAKA